jgi:hypothetical protein
VRTTRLSNTDTQYPPPTSASASSQPVNIHVDYITGNSISKLVSNARLIVIGKVSAVGEIINLGNYGNGYRGIGQVYEFKVERTLKGDAPATILVVQGEGFLREKEIQTTETIQQAKENFKYIPMEIGKNYLLFLNPKMEGPADHYFFGDMQPWRFDISDPDRVIAESPWDYVDTYFPPQPLEVVLEQIAHPELIITPVPLETTYPPQSPR